MNETSPSPSGRRFRKLRIALSAVCGVISLLLVALWVRSYYVPLKLIRPNTTQTEAIGVLSNRGRLMVGRFELAALAADPQVAELTYQLAQEQIELTNLGKRGRSDQIRIQKLKIAIIQQQIAQYRTQFALFRPINRPIVPAVVVPHWVPLLLAATLAAASWIRWRFSLRTLLIGMTLVAVLLGAVIWAVK